MQRVTIAFAPGPGMVWLREIDGRVELAPRGTGVADSVALVDALLAPGPGAVAGPGDAGRLATADRDRLLAAIHRDCFGPRIDGTVGCIACGSRFDLDFALADLEASLRADADAAAAAALPDGSFRTAAGDRFRLPTGDDELALLDLAAANPDDEAASERAAAALLDRCLLTDRDSRAATDPALVETAMQAVAPLLDLELDAVCPECGARQSLAFCLERYLLTALVQRRGETLREVHRLAAAYGWSLGEILALPRPQRRALAGMVEAERPAPSAMSGGPFG